MVATLELYDGTTTLDLYDGADYKVRTPFTFGTPPADVSLAALSLRGYRYRPRILRFGLRVIGTTVADLSANVRTLEGMLVVAKERQRLGEGTIVLLKTQLGNTDADDVDYRVLSGDIDLGPVLAESSLAQFTARDGTLTLLLEPLGRLASVSTSAATVENEQDGANLNFMDITDLAVGEAGETQEAGRLQLKVHDPATVAWGGSKKMWVAKRSGSRRADSLFIQGEAEASFTEVTDPSTGDNTIFSSNGAFGESNTSGGQVSLVNWVRTAGGWTLSSGYQNIAYTQYDIAGGSLPNGLFRLLVRGRAVDDSGVILAGELNFSLGYVFGGKTKTPVSGEEVTISSANLETIDIGELSIPPLAVPDGFTAPTLNIRIYAATNAAATRAIGVNDNLTFKIDYIFLLPIDEGMWAVDSIATADRVLADSQSDKPGIYVLNSSDVVQKFATKTGSPFDIGPEDTRIYWLRDDVGDPTAIQAVVTPVYLPQVRSF